MEKVTAMSERFVFGSIIIGGYYVTMWLIGLAPGLSDAGRSVMRDGLLTVGPIIGIIAQSIWKQDKASNDTASAVKTLAENASNASPQSNLPVADGGAGDPGPNESGKRFGNTGS